MEYPKMVFVTLSGLWKTEFWVRKLSRKVIKRKIQRQRYMKKSETICHSLPIMIQCICEVLSRMSVAPTFVLLFNFLK
jgi:hypothetical protein